MLGFNATNFSAGYPKLTATLEGLAIKSSVKHTTRSHEAFKETQVAHLSEGAAMPFGQPLLSCAVGKNNVRIEHTVTL